MSTPAERAAARSSWPVTRTTPGAPEEAAPLDGTAAWNAVLELTWQAYSLAGLMPDPISRASWPSKIFRPGEKRPDSQGLIDADVLERAPLKKG